MRLSRSLLALAVASWLLPACDFLLNTKALASAAAMDGGDGGQARPDAGADGGQDAGFDAGLPCPATDLTVTVLWTGEDGGELELQWQECEGTEAETLIQRRDTNGDEPFATVGEVDAGVESYIDNVKDFWIYSYQVIASGPGGEAAPSNTYECFVDGQRTVILCTTDGG